MKINNTLSNSVTSTQELLANKLKNVLQQDNTITQNRSFDSIDAVLKDLFSKTNEAIESNSKLLEVLKNLPIFKSFGGISKELNSLSKMLNDQPLQNNIKQSLQNATLDMKKIDTNILKSHLSKSGIFLESFIKNFIQKEGEQTTQMLENIKSSLLELAKSPNEDIKNQANKILTQLEYFALFSYLNDSNKIPLSLDWDELNDGDIEFFKSSKELQTCSINLNLEKYGEIKVNLSCDEHKQINIAFLCEQGSLKQKVQENLPQAKQMIYNADLKLQSIGVHDLKEQKDIEDKFQDDLSNDYETDIRV